jgi:hypothetical protein
MPRRLPAALVTVAAALAVAPAADAIIQPQLGISGVRLDMTPARVRQGLGAPTRIVTGRNDFGRFREYHYGGALVVVFQGLTRVTGITLLGRTDRTTSGVGVGSTERGVRNGVRGVRCETSAGARACHVGAFVAGRRVTLFVLRRGRVASVTIGYVSD